MKHQNFKLFDEIVALSRAGNWEDAKQEWSLHEIYEAEESDICLCGHFPIIEICVLQNKINGNITHVGNVCVKKFLGLPSHLIFQCIKRIRKDRTKSLNAETLGHARDKGWINDWEYSFSVDTRHKKMLSERQQNKRRQINEKILRHTFRSRSK